MSCKRLAEFAVRRANRRARWRDFTFDDLVLDGVDVDKLMQPLEEADLDKLLQPWP